ncbi:hypothetical protein ACFQPF_13040 [Fictibacillus iocasae]|uniref:Uncharacterized protein n=1 Tax=Fictibacillus iocasae TaxID=2715437 RepID=A0ABW2NSR3_9BACL
MLKIDPSVKRKDIPDHFFEQLSFIESWKVKSSVLIVTFIMLDLLILVPLISPPIEWILWLTMPPISVINLWALTMLVRKAESIHYEFILFIGSIGAVGSFTYYVLVQKMAIMILKGHFLSFFFVSTLGYVAFFVFQIWFYKKKYSSLDSKFGLFKDLPWHYKALYWSLPVGAVFAQFVMSRSEFFMVSVMIIVYSFFSGFFTCVSVKFFHRFFFMSANEHLLRFPGETKKTRKKRMLRSQRQVIEYED